MKITPKELGFLQGSHRKACSFTAQQLASISRNLSSCQPGTMPLQRSMDLVRTSTGRLWKGSWFKTEKALQSHFRFIYFKWFSSLKSPASFVKNVLMQRQLHTTQRLRQCKAACRRSKLLPFWRAHWKHSRQVNIRVLSWDLLHPSANPLKEPVAASDSENRVPSLNCSRAI